MFCKQCGKQIPDSALFCSGCGTPTGKARAAAGETVNPAGTSSVQNVDPQLFQQPTQQAVQQPIQQPAQQAVQQPIQQPAQQPAQYPYASEVGSYQQIPPASESVPAAGNPTVSAPVSTSVSTTSDYTKLGGWLLFFVICWIIDGVYDLYVGISGWVATSSYLSMLNMYGMGGLSTLIVIICLIAIVSGIIGFAMAYLVYKRDNRFLRFYQIYCVAFFVIYIVFAIMMAAFFGGYGISVGTYGANLIPGAIGFIVGVVLMTVYFCKSIRVRTYMGGTEYQQLALFRIGA